MAGDPLTDWRLTLDGSAAMKVIEQVGRKIDDLGKSLASDRKEADETQRKATDARASLLGAQGSIRDLQNLATGSIAAATYMTRSHAMAGFSGSIQGQQADAYGQLLNRQVAAIFAPLLEEKTKYVSQMTSWLQQLNEPQRESIRTLASFSLSMATLGYTVPKVTRGLAAMVTSNATVGRIAGMIGVGGAIGGALLASTPQGRDAMAGVVRALEPAVNSLAAVIKDVTPALIDFAKGSAQLIAAGHEWFRSQNFGGRLDNVQGMFSEGLSLSSIMRGMAGGLTGIQMFNRPNATASPPAAGGNLSPVPKGFEEIEAAYNRISEAATKIDLQQTIADNTAATAQNTAMLLDAMQGAAFGAAQPQGIGF